MNSEHGFEYLAAKWNGHLLQKAYNDYNRSSKTKNDKANYVADCTYVVCSFLSEAAAMKNPRFKTVTLAVLGGKGVIQGVTNNIHHLMFDDLYDRPHDLETLVNTLSSSIKNQYKRNYHAATDTLHDLFNHFGF